MKALLPAPAYEMLKKSLPSHSRSEENSPFEETFKGYGMWFNHVIRIRNYDMINIRSLWKFITRGVMVVCASNQRGVDIVLPVCKTNRNRSPRLVTAIIIQVKNDKTFRHQWIHHVKQGLVDVMRHHINKTLIDVPSRAIFRWGYPVAGHPNGLRPRR
jgi:hypothetical protein